MFAYKFLHIKLLIKQFVILIGIYFLCRLTFYVYNYSSFNYSTINEDIISFLGGVLFDLSAIAYTNLLYVLLFIPIIFVDRVKKSYQNLLDSVFVGVNFVSILFNIIDIEYFRFQKKRTGAELFSGENDIIELLPSYLKDYWWMILISIMYTLVLYIFYKKSNSIDVKERKAFVGLKTISIIFIFGMLIIAARGGIQTKPIQIISASQYGNPLNASLTLNTPFTIIQSIGKKTLEEKKYFKEEELDSIFTIQKNYASDTLFVPKNVVIIILESFSNEYIGALNKKINYTPFLDSLINESFLFENGFANGKKSNEAMPSIIASIPSLLDDAYSGSVYQNNNINSLASILNSKGYHSMFFHGGFNGSMNFDAFAKKAGFKQYYGMDEYDNLADYDGNWGIYDEPFFRFFAKTLGSSPKPFFATLFSLSSHPPFAIPSEYKERFKNIKTDKEKSFAYTDLALSNFFAYVKTKKWYYNTLFVLLPDHTPDAIDPYFDTKVSYYKIPIIFFDPSRNWKGKSEKIASQIDVMPSVLDYLHYDNKFNAFGTSLWRNSNDNYSVNYRDGIYQLIDSTHVIQYIPEGVSAMYNYRKDWYLKTNTKNKEVHKAEEMKLKLQAIIQKYNSTLIKNKYND
jgi:phosphoglycerol transferase MdoB-like AlkP superfamily enzyme